MSTRHTLPMLIGATLLALGLEAPASAWQFLDGNFGEPPSAFTVEAASQTVDLPQGTSRSLRFDFKIPELLVDNPEFVRATPISANEIVVTGLRTGLANLTVTDPDKRRTVIAINVTPDVRRLQMALASHFKTSNIQVFPLQDGVLLKGTVARADDVDVIMEVAQNYVPTKVINQLTVDGAQVVATEVKIYEVSRTKLRNLGVDWSVVGRDFNIVSGFADVITNLSNTTNTESNFRFGVIDDNTSVDLFINMLEKRNLAKLMASPTLVAQNGRAAQFLSGGQIPFQVNAGFGNNSIQFRDFGTKLDLVPIIHGQGELTLEVRAEVSEVANDLSAGTGVPGFRVRSVDTAVPMRAGQTLALAGDYREKVDTEVKGNPFLMNKPNWGIPFRNTRSEENETELVFILTPKFINAVDASQFTGLGPGQNSAVPSNRELFANGYVEVPRCPGDSCPTQPPFSQTGQGVGGEQLLIPQTPLGMTPAAPNNQTNPAFGYPQQGNSGFDRNLQSPENAFTGNPTSPAPAASPYFQNPQSPTPAAGGNNSAPGYGYPTTQNQSSRNGQRWGQNTGGVRR